MLSATLPTALYSYSLLRSPNVRFDLNLSNNVTTCIPRAVTSQEVAQCNHGTSGHFTVLFCFVGASPVDNLEKPGHDWAGTARSYCGSVGLHDTDRVPR